MLIDKVAVMKEIQKARESGDTDLRQLRDIISALPLPPEVERWLVFRNGDPLVVFKQELTESTLGIYAQFASDKVEQHRVFIRRADK